MPREVFRLLIDTPQRRVLFPLMALTVGFSDWRPDPSSDVWFEPVTRTAILAPTPKHPEFRSSGTGDYQRLRKGDYWVGGATGHVGDPDRWDDHDRGMVTGDWFVCNRHSDTIASNQALYTTRHWSQNQGFQLSYYANNLGNERWIQLECGWGVPGSEGAVSLRIWSDGEVEVWKDSVRMGTGSLQGSSTGGATQTAGECIDLLLLPWRRRELLISTNQGGGFAQCFLDLDDDLDDQIILPAGQFWWQMPEGSAQVQLHAVKYRSAGFVVSRKFRMRTAPGVGRNATVRAIGFPGTTFDFETILLDGPGTAEFESDGLAVEARVRVDLTGSGFGTQYLNGALAEFSPVFTTTPDESLDITALCRGSISVDIPESPEDVRLSVKIKDEAGYETYTKGSNRAARLMYGDLVVMELRSEPPGFKWRSDEVQFKNEVPWEFRDIWKGLDIGNRFRDDYPLDQMTLAEAFRFLFQFVVDPDLCVIDSALETFKIEPTDGDDDFSALIKVGDTPGKWIRRLHEDYCGDMFLGFKPTADGYVPHVIKLQRDAAPLIDLYPKVADAATNAEIPEDWEAREFVVNSHEERELEAEANVIFVTGWDPAARAPIFVSMEDERSTDPNLIRSARPLNHMGEPVEFGLVDPTLTRLAIVEKVCQTYYNKITWPRWLAESQATVQIVPGTSVPLWRGDAMRIVGRGVWQVESANLTLMVEKATWVRRKANYGSEFLYA